MRKTETKMKDFETEKNIQKYVVKSRQIMEEVAQDVCDYIDKRRDKLGLEGGIKFKVVCDPEATRVLVKGRFSIGTDTETGKKYAFGFADEGWLALYTNSSTVPEKFDVKSGDVKYTFDLLDLLQMLCDDEHYGMFEVMDLRKTNIKTFRCLRAVKLICPVVEINDLGGAFEDMEVSELDISRLNTSECRNFSGMLQYNDMLEEIRLGGLDMANGRDLSWLCYNCRNLRKVDFGWNEFDNVRDCEAMFECCENLKSVRMTHEAWMNLRKASGSDDLYEYFNKNMNLVITT